MKKKLLLLAGILALGATTFTAEETNDLGTFLGSPVKKAGYAQQSLRFYGDSESEEDAQMRLETIVNTSITEKISLYIRHRDYFQMPGETYKSSDEFRMRAYYDNGNLGDTELKLTQLVGYDDDYLRYQANLYFTDYLKGASTAYLGLGGRHYRSNGQGVNNQARYDLYTAWNLGHGFSASVNLYGAMAEEREHEKRLDGNGDSLKNTKNNPFLASESYLYYNKNLGKWKDGKYSLDYYLETYITTTHYSKDRYSTNDTTKEVTKSNKNSSSFGYFTTLKVTNKINDYLRVYGDIGVSGSRSLTDHSSNFGTYAFATIGWRATW